MPHNCFSGHFFPFGFADGHLSVFNDLRIGLLGLIKINAPEVFANA